MLVWTFIGFHYKPLAAAILAYVFVIGRILYSVGYIKTPNNRMIGAYILDLALIGQFVLSLVTIGNWGNII